MSHQAWRMAPHIDTAMASHFTRHLAGAAATPDYGGEGAGRVSTVEWRSRQRR